MVPGQGYRGENQAVGLYIEMCYFLALRWVWQIRRLLYFPNDPFSFVHEVLNAVRL